MCSRPAAPRASRRDRPHGRRRRPVVGSLVQSRSYHASGVHDHNSVVTTFGAGPFVAGSTHRVPRTSAPGWCRSRRATQSVSSRRSSRAGRHAARHTHVRPVPGVSLRDTGHRRPDNGDPPRAQRWRARRWDPAIKSKIEEAFGCQVTEIYGLGDITPSLLGECPVGGGLHWCGQGIVWPELIDAETGEPVAIEPGASASRCTHRSRVR